ncbi:hypothetical protein BC829DRAFT_399743 [Chytridium lagenaria]|nr:hypothetical protein BC829DRAFT_399743 [Chytridium lagenaria]
MQGEAQGNSDSTTLLLASRSPLETIASTAMVVDTPAEASEPVNGAIQSIASDASLPFAHTKTESEGSAIAESTHDNGAVAHPPDPLANGGLPTGNGTPSESIGKRKRSDSEVTADAVKAEDIDNVAQDNINASTIGARQSSKSLPSHNTRWTDEENERLLEAVQLYGLKSWRSVSEYLQTRTILQVKNRVRHLLESGFTFETGATLGPAPAYYQPPPPPPPWLVGGTPSAPITQPGVKWGTAAPIIVSAKYLEESPEPPEPGEDDNPASPEEVEKTAHDRAGSRTSTPEVSARGASRKDSTEKSKLPAKSRARRLSDAEFSLKERAPDEPPAFTFDYNSFHPVEEREPTAGKARPYIKTLSRYMLIRNHIYKLWEKYKAENKYLSRSAARPGLKGDVHAISRVHDFMERAGVINTGVVDPKRKSLPPKAVNDLTGSDDATGIVGNAQGEWVDRSELNEGRRITHGPNGEKMLAKNAKYFADEELEKIDPTLLKRKRRHATRQHYFYGDENDNDDAMDPFRLVKLSDFAKATDESKDLPPFSCYRQTICSGTSKTAVMDFHAHMSMTEIIGLLGGIYQPDNRVLLVNDIFPCRSNGTGIQCEMDPESEVQAHMYFAERSLSITPWKR